MKDRIRFARFLRTWEANIGPNRFHHSRNGRRDAGLGQRSSTFRSDKGYLMYIITTVRITSGEMSNQRKGLLLWPYGEARRHSCRRQSVGADNAALAVARTLGG